MFNFVKFHYQQRAFCKFRRPSKYIPLGPFDVTDQRVSVEGCLLHNVVKSDGQDFADAITRSRIRQMTDGIIRRVSK